MAMLVSSSATAMQAQTDLRGMARESKFDTDSAPMGIDNRCSTCMPDRGKDFVPGSLRPVNYSMEGVGGIKIKGVEVGTMIFSIEDDDGMVHTSEIPGSHLVPSLGTRLFSPQHFARVG